MFRLGIFKHLTTMSDNIIDWTRTGELLFSDQHKYSREELMRRGAITLATAAISFLGYSLNNEDKTQCSNVTMSLLSGLLGFIVLHRIAITSVVNKRKSIRAECDILKEKIKVKSNELALSQYNINILLTNIYKISLAEGNRANASQTWGHRRTILKNLHKCLEENDILFLHHEDVDLKLEYLELKTLRNKRSLG